MALKDIRAAVALSTMIAVTSPLVVRTPTQQDCSQVIDQIERETRAFRAAAEKEAMYFAIDGGVDAAILDAGKILKATTAPTMDGAAALGKHVKTLETWETVQQAFGVTLQELYVCLSPGSRCDLPDFMRKQKEAFQRWMQTFLSDGTQAALDRVSRARSLLQNHVKQLSGMAEGSMKAALKSCDNDYQQRAQAAQNAVDPREASPQRGMSLGKQYLVGGVIVGTALGGMALAAALKDKAADASAVTDITMTGGVGGFGSFFNVKITPALDHIGITCNWAGSSGSQATRTTFTNPNGTAACANSDVFSWADNSIVLSATVTAKPSVTTSLTYYP